jgi:hypothetical protein
MVLGVMADAVRNLLWLADEIWVALDQASAEEPASQGRSKTGQPVEAIPTSALAELVCL